MVEDDGQGALRVTVDGKCFEGVCAVRAFPTTYDDRFVSLRHYDDSSREVEVGMISALAEWPRHVREAVQRSLDRRYLLRRILEIRQIRTLGNQLAFSVVTDGGPARFQLERPSEGFQSFGRQGLMLVDAEGNYYVVPDRGALADRQQRLLALYLGH